MRTLQFASLVLAAGLHAATPIALEKLPPPAQRKVDFVAEVYPVFKEACFRCHGPERQKGKYRMDSRKDAFKETSEWGPAIQPGDSRRSAIVRMMAGLVEEMLMPPPGGKAGESDPLSPEQIGIIRAWIDQGASWPDGPIQTPIKVVTFKEQILPQLKALCSECHSGEKVAGGFSIDSAESLIKGGSTYGKAVIAGNPDRSPLITIVSGKDEDIPQPQKHRLPDKGVQSLREWIKAGAKD